jgi:ribosomal protein S18 acetylase RimI-like enzyme
VCGSYDAESAREGIDHRELPVVIGQPSRNFAAKDVRGSAADLKSRLASSGARDAWIHHLAVLPDLQGGGIGRMLMDELERRLRAVGATKLNLLVERGNAGVTDFYRKLGYDPDELLFMTKQQL